MRHYWHLSRRRQDVEIEDPPYRLDRSQPADGLKMDLDAALGQVGNGQFRLRGRRELILAAKEVRQIVGLAKAAEHSTAEIGTVKVGADWE